MKGQRTRIVGAIALLLVAGCQTPGAVGSGAMSASDSNSGNSSGNSNSGDSGSGNSSGNSDSGSEGSSNSDSSQSQSSQSTNSDSSQSQSSQSTNSDSSQSQSESSQSSKSDSSQSQSSQNEASQSQSGGSSENSKSSQNSSGGGNVLTFSTVGATVGGLGLAFWMILKAPPVGPPPPANVGEAAQAYLRARTHQLREDLALGAGPSIEDLAAMARIRRENLRLFGRLLREHRGELLSLAEASTLTPERALGWLERVGQLARTEPRLEEDRRAFLAVYGVVE
ncbi:hypothetical protein [Archangium lansingense]|uniref:Lipoprotein n=1 Tax=Archangium lansingense TaxID=2995310 RepID=A0ABT3ZZA4_9BACT|nr:hypothetical protein [Archangium lansinium]MCY1074735.1 hypothetical protein [Archangium lansinium]